MTAVIPNYEPSEIIAGDYLQWTRSLPDYLASAGWVLTYTLINATHKITIAATASGADFAVAIANATSAGYTAGVYRWQAAVALAGVTHIVDTGEIRVKPGFAAASTLETRSPAKITLDAIEAEILARAQGGMTQEYTIGSRSLKKCTVPDLIVLRDRYQAIYTSEQNAERVRNGMSGNNRILVRL